MTYAIRTTADDEIGFNIFHFPYFEHQHEGLSEYSRQDWEQKKQTCHAGKKTRRRRGKL
jgi:hypothetical protein